MAKDMLLAHSYGLSLPRSGGRGLNSERSGLLSELRACIEFE